MFYRHTYQVVGSGPFPLDMLRYDASYPVSESRDSWAIHNSLSHHEEAPFLDNDTQRALMMVRGNKSLLRGWVVTLEHDTPDKNWEPTNGRWASFLWYVIPGTHDVERR